MSDNSNKLLLAINNQCELVQRIIETSFEYEQNEELNKEILYLLSLLIAHIAKHHQ